MLTIQHSIVIHQPVERVFEVAANPLLNPKWQQALVRVSITPDGPVQVGSVVTNVRKVRDASGSEREREAAFEITALEQNSVLAFRGLALAEHHPFQSTMRFEPVEGSADAAGASTKLSFTIEMEGPQEIADFLQKDMEISYARLKELLEQKELRHIPDGKGPQYMIVGSDIITFKIVGNDKDTDGSLFLSEIVLLPDGGPGLHRHIYEETFYVLEGELVFMGGGLQPEFIARAGDVIHVPSYAPHGYRAITKTRLLTILTPAGAEDFFAAIGTPVPEQGEVLPTYKLPDPVFWASLLEKHKIELLSPVTLTHS